MKLLQFQWTGHRIRCYYTEFGEPLTKFGEPLTEFGEPLTEFGLEFIEPI